MHHIQIISDISFKLHTHMLYIIYIDRSFFIYFYVLGYSLYI